MKKLKKMISLLFISLFLLQIPGCKKDEAALLQEIIAKDTSKIIKPDTTKIDTSKIDTSKIDPVKTDTTKKDTVIAVEKITGNKIYVTNPGTDKDIQPNILKAYSQAKDGDMIILPAGKFSFSGSVFITKLVSLKGAGRDATILYRPENISDASISSPMFYFNINRDISSNIIISGITLRSKKPADLSNNNGSLALDQGILIKNAVDFTITGCRFENFGFSGVTIYHRDNLARGLIYSNQFYHNFKGDHRGYGFGIDVEGGNSTWIANPQFGSNNFIFIEDNTFDYHFQAINGNTGAVFVSRYNKINNNWIDAGINMHEQYGVGFPCRAAEIYNNEINATKFGNGTLKATDIVPGRSISDLFVVAISPKGGDALVFNNKISGYRYALHVAAFPSYYKDSSYPVHFGLGYKSAVRYGSVDSGFSGDHGDGDGFFWNNSLVTYLGYTPKLFTNWSPTWFKESRDFHFVKKPNYIPYTYPHPLRK